MTYSLQHKFQIWSSGPGVLAHSEFVIPKAVNEDADVLVSNHSNHIFMSNFYRQVIRQIIAKR